MQITVFKEEGTALHRGITFSMVDNRNMYEIRSIGYR
jgi:hypothetical protein